MTLVIINGILTFMLTPGKWITSHYWFDGVFNPTYWPSLIIRLLIMGGIAGMYALVTSSRIKDPEFRTYMVRYCAKWLLPIFVVGPFVSYWFLTQIPQATIATIFTGIQSSGRGQLLYSQPGALFELYFVGYGAPVCLLWTVSQSEGLYLPHSHFVHDLRPCRNRYDRMDAGDVAEAVCYLQLHVLQRHSEQRCERAF